MAERYAMDFLEGMAVAGLTHLVNSVVGMRAKIEEQWSMTFARIYKFLLEHAPDGVSDRVLQTHAAPRGQSGPRPARHEFARLTFRVVITDPAR